MLKTQSGNNVYEQFKLTSEILMWKKEMKLAPPFEVKYSEPWWTFAPETLGGGNYDHYLVNIWTSQHNFQFNSSTSQATQNTACHISSKSEICTYILLYPVVHLCSFHCFYLAPWSQNSYFVHKTQYMLYFTCTKYSILSEISVW